MQFHYDQRLLYMYMVIPNSLNQRQSLLPLLVLWMYTPSAVVASGTVPTFTTLPSSLESDFPTPHVYRTN